MALKLTANYSKRLGLPGYSSHQFSVSVETEITNINDVAGESTRLYQTLQQSVDDEIKNTGFVPEQGYGRNDAGVATSDISSNGHYATPREITPNGHSASDEWTCSDKQRDLIIKLVDEHSLDKKFVDETSREMFGAGVRELNKLQASGLIDRLLEENSTRKTRRTVKPRRAYQNGGAR